MLLDRRSLLAGAAAAAVARPAWAAKQSGTSWYDRAVIIDGLGGIDDPYSPDDVTRLSDRAWQESRATGVTVVQTTVAPVGNDPKIWDSTLAGIDRLDAAINANPDRLRKILKAADIASAKAEGRIGLIYGTQDTSMVGSALDRIAELKAKGVRVMQLTYNLRNLSGDGSLEPDDAGLSRLGHATISRIEKERLLLDLAHGGARTIREAIAAATRPPTISHTGARALHDHPRNVSDEILKALADKGGVAGVYFMPYLVPSSKPSGEDLVRHVEHMARVCGEDHIAIGTDGNLLPIPINAETYRKAKEMYEMRKAAGFAAPGEYPDTLTIVMDYNRLDRFQRLADVLQRRGWSERQLEKFFGGNLQRLYTTAWAE